MSAYTGQFKGNFKSALRWHDLDDLWATLKTLNKGQWYIYHVGEEPPVETEFRVEVTAEELPIDTDFGEIVDEVTEQEGELARKNSKQKEPPTNVETSSVSSNTSVKTTSLGGSSATSSSPPSPVDVGSSFSSPKSSPGSSSESPRPT